MPCVVLHGSALFVMPCVVLHGSAFMALYLHGSALSIMPCVVLHGSAFYGILIAWLCIYLLCHVFQLHGSAFMAFYWYGSALGPCALLGWLGLMALRSICECHELGIPLRIVLIWPGVCSDMALHYLVTALHYGILFHYMAWREGSACSNVNHAFLFDMTCIANVMSLAYLCVLI